LVLVGIGGALGAVCRFQLGKIISQKSKTAFPWGTFVINITGAFFLGIVANIPMANGWLLFGGNGFLGAYTTFSTFMYEGFQLFSDHEKLNAFTYIAASLILGLVGYAAGWGIGGWLNTL